MIDYLISINHKSDLLSVFSRSYLLSTVFLNDIICCTVWWRRLRKDCRLVLRPGHLTTKPGMRTLCNW